VVAGECLIREIDYIEWVGKRIALKMDAVGRYKKVKMAKIIPQM